MRKKTLIAAVIMVAAIVIVGGYAAVTVFGTKDKTEYLVAQVYISGWHSNTTQNIPMNVSFKISLDLNNDGTYEVQQTSQVWNNTYVEQAPFKLGGPVASNLGHFNFKIEAFKVADGVLTPLHYTPDGTIPVNQGNSAENSQFAWMYDATETSSDSLACGIDYWYFVS